MKNILVEIKCNRCFYYTHIKSHTLVLPDLEPNLRKRILAQEMFNFTCPRCHQVISFIHPFLYHDKQHHFLLVVSQEDKNLQELQAQFPNTTIRLVKSDSELREKIAIFEDGLDDVRMEYLKDKLKQKFPDAKEIVYRDYDALSNSLWFTFLFPKQYEDVKGVDMSVYLSSKP